MPVVGRLRYLEARPSDVSSLASRPGGRAGQLHGTLILIHGFPLTARMWEPQLELAERGWRVIVPQLRGFDGPPADNVATSVDDYAGDVIDLLDGLHIEQAVIGGLSSIPGAVLGIYVTWFFGVRQLRAQGRLA